MWYYTNIRKSIIYPKSQYFDQILASIGLMQKTSLSAKFGGLTQQ